MLKTLYIKSVKPRKNRVEIGSDGRSKLDNSEVNCKEINHNKVDGNKIDSNEIDSSNEVGENKVIEEKNYQKAFKFKKMVEFRSFLLLQLD